MWFIRVITKLSDFIIIILSIFGSEHGLTFLCVILTSKYLNNNIGYLVSRTKIIIIISSPSLEGEEETRGGRGDERQEETKTIKTK